MRGKCREHAEREKQEDEWKEMWKGSDREE